MLAAMHTLPKHRWNPNPITHQKQHADGESFENKIAGIEDIGYG